MANQRRDFLHKLSRYYVERYDVVCAEDLAVAGMLEEKRAVLANARKRTLHRHVADAGWRVFLNMLTYKAQVRQEAAEPNTEECWKFNKPVA